VKDIVLVTVECLRTDYADRLSEALPGQPEECITAAHFTRPTLAGLHSGRVQAAVKSECQRPTIAERLSGAGYSTIAVSHTPQTPRTLNFHAGFDDVYHEPDPAGGRGSYWREWLGQFRPVRAVHRRVRPKAATLEAIPSDETAVDQAIAAWEKTASPRFLWLHLMDTHRPYGRGEDALPEAVSRRAAAASPGRLSLSLTGGQAETIQTHYERALERAQAHLARLIESIGDAALVVVGDHGEEFGEHGYWFHGPYRRRTVDTLTHVPLWTRGVEIGDGLVRQVDVPTSLARVADLSSPASWTGTRLGTADHAMTVAPWAGTAACRYETATESIRLEDGAISAESVATIDETTEQQLAALGYV